MIKKLEMQEIEQPTGSEYTIIERVPATSEQMHDKINELCDVVNKLETMAKNTNTVLESLVQENNIHEKQIDELQMMLEPIKCKTRPENVQPGAETRPENVQDEIDKAKREGRVLFPDPADVATALTKTLRMDKELAEDECVRLQDELGRTKRALEIAVKHLREITDVGGWVSVFSEQEIAQQALEQITTITKDGNK